MTGMTGSSNLPLSTRPTLPPVWSPPVWVRVAVLLVALLVGTGAFVALLNPLMLAGESGVATGAVRILAGYLFTRNLAIAALLVFFLFARFQTPLCAVMLLTAVVQALDAAVDCYEQRWAIIPGIIVISVVALLVANNTLDGPAWKLDSWRRS